ncbi:heterokaryon incompatibility protein-domain-containing protein, partial [Amylocystis lapponica]
MGPGTDNPTQNTRRSNLGALLAEYIANTLPANIIYVPEMKLVARNEIQQKVQARVNESEDPGEVPEGKIEEVVFEKNIKDALGYAILSHRWMNGEPTFQGFKTVRWRMLPWNASAAFKKLRAFCNLARMHGCDWAWTDTCCIDKTSSAELDEAIRSMYKWYADAKICIVYLAETTSPS